MNPNSLENLARLLIVAGVILALIGGGLYLAAKFGIPLGRLPGDIRIQSGRMTCIFPLVTSIVLSILLTVILNLVIRFLNR